jgi:hypothetical protein
MPADQDAILCLCSGNVDARYSTSRPRWYLSGHFNDRGSPKQHSIRPSATTIASFSSSCAATATASAAHANQHQTLSVIGASFAIVSHQYNHPLHDLMLLLGVIVIPRGVIITPGSLLLMVAAPTTATATATATDTAVVAISQQANNCR